MSDNKSQQQPPHHPPVDTPCVPPTPSQFDLLMKDYGIILKDELQQTSANLEAQVITASTATQVTCVERKVNEKYARSVREYNFLSNCITVYTGQDLDGINNTITQLLVPKSRDIKTSFDAAIALIKTAKQKVGLVSTAAVKLKDAVADSCNSEELKLIRENLSKGGSNKKSLEESVQEFVNYANKIVNQVDDVAQAAVKVAGINSFINIDNLAILVAATKTDGAKLITDVEANVKSSQKKYDDSRVPLGNALKGLSSAVTDMNKAWNLKNAVTNISQFVEDKDCQHDCKNLDDISDEAEHAFDSANCNPGQSEEEA
ncbi:hypothetical protein SAMN05518672_1034 [Chitinophaga sp. CF118]|uniref:hypothetical protein n=1 Tax=Chitinophaga sp. CF118 TaxID=1884367 RepID=UPI0008ECC355|nr:hypothetical protein [Chitinophaga sp. CF118]SFD73640.1 hypothetical protein SAMN05518672_1034 [Chitinophaga sp. CF118]